MFTDHDSVHTESEKGLELIDLLSLQEGDPRLDNFKKRVAQCGGTIQMWVHTHYEEEGEPVVSHDEVLDRYQKGRAKFMEHPARIPIVALLEMAYSQHVPENEQGPEHVEQRYRKHYTGVSDTIFFVRTYPHNPTPYNIEELSGPNERTDAWDVLSEKLKDVGVKHIVFRGRNLEVTEGYEIQDEGQRGGDVSEYARQHRKRKNGGWIADTPGGCVGQSMRELNRRGFTILPSRWTYPHQLRRSSL